MEQPLSDLQAATHHAVIDGPGRTDAALRRRIASGQPQPELKALVRKIHDQPYAVTDRDIDALRSRYTEDQLFELIVAAALGAAEDRLNAALAALEAACG
jgi:alkylhydroperoxidase family enzyme